MDKARDSVASSEEDRMLLEPMVREVREACSGPRGIWLRDRSKVSGVRGAGRGQGQAQEGPLLSVGGLRAPAKCGWAAGPGVPVRCRAVQEGERVGGGRQLPLINLSN